MKKSKSEFANKGEISKSDEVIAHPTGREGTPAADRGTAIASDLATAPTTQPTDHHYDVGSGEEETSDGFDPQTEAVRKAAEDTPSGGSEEEDIPVFDRADEAERL